MEKLRRITCAILVFSFLFVFAACGSDTETDGTENSYTKGTVSEVDHIKIDGMFVDESYKDEDNESMKLLYVFYTATAKVKNLELTAISLNLKINDANSYSSTLIRDAASYMQSYYYLRKVEKLNVGESLKVVSTIKVPSGDLVSGKNIAFSSSEIPEVENLKMFTDDIKSCKNAEEIAKIIDPDGYAKEVEARKDADEATNKKVKKLINGYYFSFSTVAGSAVTYNELSFDAPNKFTIESTISGYTITNDGIYTVKNGYIVLKYNSDSDGTNKISVRYDFDENGDINIYADDAFQI